MEQPGPATSVTGRAIVPSRCEEIPDKLRRYCRDQAAVFLKTREGFGGLSNMAAGLPLHVNGADIRTAEALYQACRFPHRPDVQREILRQRSPMTAKMKSKRHRWDSRPDWSRVRVRVMRWCLEVKLAQNWETFAGLLKSTGDLPIVEESRRDDFWGARPDGEDLLVGMNILGRLLMELRNKAQKGGLEAFRFVPPPDVDYFRLLDRNVGRVLGLQGVEECRPSSALSGNPELRRPAWAVAPGPPTGGAPGNTEAISSDGDLRTRIRSMVRDHPARRYEINASLRPLLPMGLSDNEKRKRITSHLRSLRRAGWIEFDRADLRWKLGNRRALLSPGDTLSSSGETS